MLKVLGRRRELQADIRGSLLRSMLRGGGSSAQASAWPCDREVVEGVFDEACEHAGSGGELLFDGMPEPDERS